MSHKYFTINERNKLEVLLKENYKVLKLLKSLTDIEIQSIVKLKGLKGDTPLKMLS